MSNEDLILRSVLWYFAGLQLGHLAAQCELNAAQHGLYDWERRSLLRQAAAYREAQLAQLKKEMINVPVH